MRLKKYHLMVCLILWSTVYATDYQLEADTEAQAVLDVSQTVLNTSSLSSQGFSLSDSSAQPISTSLTLGYDSTMPGSAAGALSSSDSLSLQHNPSIRAALLLQTSNPKTYNILPAISLQSLDESIIIQTTATSSGAANFLFSGALLGSGILETAGLGTVTFTDLSGFNGQIYVGNGLFQSETAEDFSGFLSIAASSVAAFKGSLSSSLIFIDTNGALKMQPASNDAVISGQLIGQGSLIVDTPDYEVILTGANNLTGGINVLDGSLGLTSQSAQGNIVASAGTFVNFYAGSTTSGSYSSTLPIYFGGLITGQGTIAKYGDDILFMQQAPANSGGILLYEGSLCMDESSLSGNIEAASGTSLFLNIDTDLSYTSNITGSGNIVKSGGGLLTTTADWAYSSLTIEDGGLILTQGSFDSSNTGPIINNGSLLVDITSNTVFNQPLSGTGIFEKTGAAQLELTGGVRHSGSFLISGGQLVFDELTDNLGDITNNAAVIFDIASGSTLEAHSALTGTGSLQKTGSGTLILDSSVQTYTGGTTVTQGTLETYQPVLNGDYSISSSATLRYNISNGDQTVSGTISGSGNFEKVGPDTLRINSSNSLSGNFTVKEFGVQQAQSNTLNSAVSLELYQSAFFDLNNFDMTAGSLSGSGAITLGSGTLTVGANNNSTTYSGIISGSGGLVKTGLGTMTMAASNTYTGPTVLQSGSIIQSVSNILSAQSALTINAGTTFDINNLTAQANTLQGAGTLIIGSGTFNYQGSDTTTATFSGDITGSGVLNKNGAGIWQISPASTLSFSGQTNINAGTLRYGIPNALPASNNIFIASGAIWDLNNTASTINQVTGSGEISLASSGILTIQSHTTPVTFAGRITGGTASNAYSFIKNGTSNLTLRGQSTYNGQTHLSAGAITLGVDNALPINTFLNIDNGATFEIANYQQSLSKIAGSGTLSIGGGSETRNALTLIGGNSSTFDGLLQGNTNAILNISNGSSLVLSSLSNPTNYQGIIKIDALSSLELQQSVIAANSAHAAAGHIQNNGTVILYSDKTKAASQSNPHNIVISGTGNVQITGSSNTGYITMTAPQTYTGITNIYQGTLDYGVNQALPSETIVSLNSGTKLDLHSYTTTLSGLSGSGTLNFDSNAVLTLTDTSNQTFSGLIDGAGSTSLLKSGSGIWTLSSTAVSQNISNASLSAGTLTNQGIIGHGLTLSGSASYILDSTGQHFLASSAYSPDNYSTESIKMGSGTSMIWRGNVIASNNTTIGRSTSSSDTPTINIQNGTLTLNDLASYSFNQTPVYGSPALNINAGYGLTINVTQANATLTSDLVFTGSGSLIKTGSGTLSLSSTQTYTGATTIDAGTITISDGVVFSTSALLNNGSFVINGTNSHTTRSFNFPITGTGSITINDMTAGTAKTLFPNSWNYRGLTTITSGQVENTGQITMNSNAYVVSPTASWRLNGATVHLTGSSSLQGAVSLASVTLDTTGATGSDQGNSSNVYTAQLASSIPWSATDASSSTSLTIESGTALTLSASARSMELGIDITGSGSLIKNGAYRAVLSPQNAVNYTGPTIVNAGTLVIDNKFSKNATSGAQVASGATLAFRNLRPTAELRSYANTNTATNTILPDISYDITDYTDTGIVGNAADNYFEYSFPISGAGGIRIETPYIANNAIYLSGPLTYTGRTTVVSDAFLYVGTNFASTGDLYVDGVMQFYTPDLGDDGFHYVNSNFYTTSAEVFGRIEKYGPGNLVLTGDFTNFYGLINIQAGKIFFSQLPPSQIEIIGLINLLAQGGSILTLNAGDEPVLFSGQIVGENNARYRLVSDMGNATLTVASLTLAGRIDLRQTFNGVNDPRNYDPSNPSNTPSNGVSLDTLSQPQFIIENLTVAHKSQFYFQFDQAYTGWQGVGPEDASLRPMAQLNFLNDSIAQYILQGQNDAGLFNDYRYRLLVFENTPTNSAKVDQIMTLLRAPTIYVVQSEKFIDNSNNQIYLDVIITKRDIGNVLNEYQAQVAPATIGIARQIQGRAISNNNYERNANKVLENAQDPDDLITQVKYLTPTGNKKEKEQSDPTASSGTGSMAHQTVLNFRQNIITKNFLKTNKSMSYQQKDFVNQAFSQRNNATKEFNKRLAGHYEHQNFSWAEVFDGLDIFGLSTSLESSYTHVVTAGTLDEPGNSISTWSSTLGVSQVLQDKYIVGVMANYSDRRIALNPNTDNKTSLVKEKIRNIGFFTAYQNMDLPYYWAAFLSFGNHGYTAERTWLHPRYDDNRAINEYTHTQATSTHKGYDISGSLEAGYTFTLSQEIALQPYMSASFTHLHEPGYRETSVAIDDNAFDASLYGNIMYPNLIQMHARAVGIQGIQSFAIDNTAYQLSTRLSYVMTKNDGDTRTFKYSYLYAPETVNELVINNERYHAFELMLGFNIAYDYQWIISANYTGSFGNRVTSHNIVGTIQYTFW